MNNGLLFAVFFMLNNCVFFAKTESRKAKGRNNTPSEAADEGVITSPLPISYSNNLPSSFSWGNVDGNGLSYLTPSLNQHLPHWCGSCWAHAAMSSLQDRIKIARYLAVTENNVKKFNQTDTTTTGPDIRLSIQFLLNCGKDSAGSCLGGSSLKSYKLIHKMGFVPYDTCQPYIACSSDSTMGFCPSVDTTCSNINICRTCTNPLKGGHCREITSFPNATISEYGIYRNPSVQTIKSEIYARGPVAVGIAGTYLHNYTGGIIIYDANLVDLQTTHAVSIIGWGTTRNLSTDSTWKDDSGVDYWIVRNSWGEYWGELSFFRIEMGWNLLGIETAISWATPGNFTTGGNVPCSEDGSNCATNGGAGWLTERHNVYVDPGMEGVGFGKRVSSIR